MTKQKYIEPIHEYDHIDTAPQHTCKTCKFWTDYGREGSCSKLGRHTGSLSTNPLDDAFPIDQGLWTGPAFGCIQWRAIG